jgi:hypothetical protein
MPANAWAARACTLQALLAQLADEVAGEDPRNGELLVRLVDAPFVALPGDKGELESWVVR